MNKLTVEVARQDLQHLKSWLETCGISMKEERYMQALEIALPILEQQERGEGWIKWGGKCGGNDQPVIGMVEVKFRNGNTQKSEACDWYWPHDGIESDIIAYRIIPEQPTNQNGEQ